MAAEQLNDKEKQFRLRARRRLIGAVALVLLMVTVLPMVLDDRSGQRMPQPEIALSIPSQDGAEFPSKVVPVAPQPEPPAPPVQMASPLEKPRESAVVPSPPAPKAPEPEKARPPAAANPAPLPQPAPKAQPAPAAAPRKGTFSVQVGVFSDAAKVAQMRSRIAEKGVQCYTEELNTPKGAKIRLRCGPYQARTEAQQALDRLKAAGFGGILVTNQ